MFKSMIHRCTRIVVYALLGLVFGVGLLACKPAPPVEEIASPQPEATHTSPPAPTDTPVPTATTPPASAFLVAPPGSDPSQVDALRASMTELAAQDDLELKVRDQVGPADLEADVRLVVVLPPDPGVQNLAQAYPETQFLALGIADLQATQNLSSIGSGGERPDQQGFLAGYLAAVITQDWRVGVISQADTAPGRAARQGFINGVIFYCGLCRPAYPPFLQYPLAVDLTAGASQEEQQAAADVLISSAVQTVYVFPGAAAPSLLEYLAQAGVNIIAGTPPPGGLEDHWVASIRVDPIDAFEQAWPKLVNGEGGLNLGMPFVLTDTNEILFSIGRQRLVERLRDELIAGYVDTGVDPQTGEPR